MATNPANIAPSDDADEFDAAFDEIASGTASTPADGADDDDLDPVPGADDTDSSSPADEAADAKANVAGDAPPAGAEPSEDIWANAPPELKEAREKELRDLNFRLSSQQGRVSALHRKLQTQERQQPGQEGGGQPAAAAAEDGANPKGDAPEDPLKQLTEDYPDIGAPIAAMIDGLKAQISELSQPVTSLAQAQAQTVKAQQYGILADRHPDWQDLSRDERWGGWIETQPRAVQEAFARNVDVSDGQEAAWVLDLFKRDMGIAAPSPAPNPAPTPTPKPTPSSADTRRKKQLDAGRDGGSNGGASVTNEMPDDFDAEFDRIAAQKLRRGSVR